MSQETHKKLDHDKKFNVKITRFQLFITQLKFFQVKKIGGTVNLLFIFYLEVYFFNQDIHFRVSFFYPKYSFLPLDNFFACYKIMLQLCCSVVFGSKSFYNYNKNIIFTVIGSEC